jgi:ABC-type transport system substrate-binding protein
MRKPLPSTSTGWCRRTLPASRWRAARIELVANPHAWRAPLVERLELREILDPSTRLQGVQSGGLDIALHITPDDADALARSGGRMHVGEGAGVSGMAFISVQDGPLADPRVRRALNHAVDRVPIVEVLLAGHTRIPSQPAPSYAPGFNSELAPYSHDPELARRLLAEAGYPDGFRFTVEVVTSGSTAAAAVYQFVAQQLARVGVRMDIRPLAISQLIQKSVSGQWDGQAFHMEFDLKPSLDPMRAIPMHSCQRVTPWHCDPAVMPLIEAAQREFDPDRRLELVREIMRVYHEDPSMLYLWESVFFDGVAARVRDYAPVNRRINYHEISVAR